MEQTLSLIKPDAVERNLIGKIINVFEDNNLKIGHMKKIHVDRQLQKNFMRCIKKEHFLTTFVVILAQVLWLLWF